MVSYAWDLVKKEVGQRDTDGKGKNQQVMDMGKICRNSLNTI